MGYTKDKQTKRTRSRKTCTQCDRDRLIKFFEKPTSHKCDDCKKRTRLRRKKKRNKKSNLKDELDSLWAVAVKDRADYECEKCGKEDYLNSHHIFSRSNHSVRWDLDNGACLCSGCHTLSSRFSAHKTPMEFTEWILEVRGDEWYDRLKKKANQTVDITYEHMLEVKGELT